MAEMRLNLLFGFLGSGKTTLARRILTERAGGEKMAVIVNEFGDVGIDGAILEGRNVDMVELTSGCLCCTLKGPLLNAVEELRDKAGARRIVIEATGVAQPEELIETFADPKLSGRYDIGPVVTVVDAPKYPKLAQVLGEFYGEQMKNADVLVLNKVDLAPAAALEAVRAEAAQINPHAEILFAERCDVDIPRLLDGPSSRVVATYRARLGEPNPPPSPSPPPPSDAPAPAFHNGAPLGATGGEGYEGLARLSRAYPELGEGGSPNHNHDHGHGHDHDHGDHRHAPAQSFVLDATGAAARADVEAFFRALPENVWRAKGFMAVDGVPALIQYAMGQLEITPAEARAVRNMVFIGPDMDRPAIEAQFRALLARHDQPARKTGGAR
jgi:G3E family GTPase